MTLRAREPPVMMSMTSYARGTSCRVRREYGETHALQRHSNSRRTITRLLGLLSSSSSSSSSSSHHLAIKFHATWNYNSHLLSQNRPKRYSGWSSTKKRPSVFCRVEVVVGWRCLLPLSIHMLYDDTVTWRV